MNGRRRGRDEDEQLALVRFRIYSRGHSSYYFSPISHLGVGVFTLPIGGLPGHWSFRKDQVR